MNESHTFESQVLAMFNKFIFFMRYQSCLTLLEPIKDVLKSFKQLVLSHYNSPNQLISRIVEH